MDIFAQFPKDLFISAVLLIFVTLYGFFAIVLAIQIITYNRLVNQISFTPIFRLIAFIHAGLTLALIAAVAITLL